jgi:hypothetical protein
MQFAYPAFVVRNWVRFPGPRRFAACAIGDERAVPEHEVGLRIPQRIWIKNVDIEIPIRSDGRLLGRIHISRGSLDWLPAQKQHRYRLSWERFAEVMAEHGRRRPL